MFFLAPINGWFLHGWKKTVRVLTAQASSWERSRRKQSCWGKAQYALSGFHLLLLNICLGFERLHLFVLPFWYFKHWVRVTGHSFLARSFVGQVNRQDNEALSDR